jgi:histidine triad (HIT) family protein
MQPLKRVLELNLEGRTREMEPPVGNCPFCRIAEGGTGARVLYRDDEVIAFQDINPQAPVHVLIIPKKHISGVNELTPGDAGLIGKVFLAAKKIVEEQNLDSGYRIVTNTGRGAGQSVYHLHFHLLAGRRFGWPPG